MSENLFEYPNKESWTNYPWLFRPKALKLLLIAVVIICLAEILISFIGIPRDAEMTTLGLEKLPVPVAISLIILFVLPLPCLVVGLLLGLIPIDNVPYRVKFYVFSLMALLPLQVYGLKELIAAAMHG